jgi:hypothetical protein
VAKAQALLRGVYHKERFPRNTEVFTTIARINLGGMGLEPGHIPGTPLPLRLRLGDGGAVRDLFQDQCRMVRYCVLLLDARVSYAGERGRRGSEI